MQYLYLLSNMCALCYKEKFEKGEIIIVPEMFQYFRKLLVEKDVKTHEESMNIKLVLLNPNLQVSLK